MDDINSMLNGEPKESYKMRNRTICVFVCKIYMFDADGAGCIYSEIPITI